MTIGPTDAELADMITDDVRAMPDTAQILRPTMARTSGGYGQGFVQIATTPCRLTASILSGGGEQAGPGQLVSTMAFTMTVPPGTDIRGADRVQVRTSLFEVIADKGDASWNLSDAVTLEKIN